jgi:phosphoribosylformylglycinamidine cyclo-ligase
MRKLTYSAAGVNLESATRAKRLITKHAHSTFRPEVLSDLGFFSALFELKGYQEPVLVSSTDGVGTKLSIASALARHNTIGIDLVNHCVNDILTCGAEPLFFLDYIAMGKLRPLQVESIITGITDACREVGCALIGGETAEMPGIYREGDYDLVGFIVGVVEKKSIINGKSIQVGDAILGLPSSGLHTNGYSLVRKIFGTKLQALNTFYRELGRTLGKELLEPHRCYYHLIQPALPQAKGIAHITGGGLPTNLPRILPPGLAAEIRVGSWSVLPIFNLIQEKGGIDEQEMYRVFNMGIGMVLYCSPSHVDALMSVLPQARLIGKVVEQKGNERVIMSKQEISWQGKGGKV